MKKISVVTLAGMLLASAVIFGCSGSATTSVVITPQPDFTDTPPTLDTPLQPTSISVVPSIIPTIIPTNDNRELSAILEAMLQNSMSGSVLVAQNGEVILSKGYGYADREKNISNTAETKFRIYSITKQFTAMAIMILQEQGELNVQDSICEYLGDCPDNWKPITIHHLLTHTSGIPDTIWPHLTQEITATHPLEQAVEDLKTKPLIYLPGERWEYNETGYVLLGKIIETASGQTYEGFLWEYIFEPLQMLNTGYDHNRDDLAIGYEGDSKRLIADPVDMEIMFSGGGLYSTVEDLYLWDQALYLQKLLPKNALDEMFTAYVPMEASNPSSDSYGYGWVIATTGKRKCVYHPGGYSGYSSRIVRYPDDQTTIILLLNQENQDPSIYADGMEPLLFGAK